MSRVFFLLKSDRFQTEEAEKFGERVFLFQNSLRSPLNPNDLILDCMDLLEENNFKLDEDYIAITGPVIQLSMFFAACLSKYGIVQALIFDARTERYHERTINAEALGIVEDTLA